MVGNKINKTIVILTNIPLSNRVGAAYSRIIEYSKAIASNSENQVYILSLNHHNHQQIIRLLPAYNIYLLGSEFKQKKNFLLNKFFGMGTRKKNFNIILELIKQLDTKVVFLLYPFFNTWYEERYYITKIKNAGYKVFSERNERALGIIFNRIKTHGLIKRIILLLVLPLELINAIKQDNLVVLYDGNIVISTSFERWIKDRNPNFLRIPILSSFTNIIKKPKKDSNLFNVGYTGTISFNKDGIGQLVEAIYLLVNKFNVHDVKLNIFGFGKKSEVNRLKRMINKFKLEEYVYYNGTLSKPEVLRVQRKQDLLVLIRKSSLQTRFGFSTKLAEYVAAKTPVLLTDVSDNRLYLKENIAAFYTTIDPNNIAKMIRNIKNKDKVLINEIIERAYMVSKMDFNIDKYKENLDKFLN